MINKLRAFLIGCCLIVVMLFLVFTIPNQSISQEKINSEESSEISSEVDTQPTLYILKDYQGQVAVYKPSEDTPMEILNIYVQNLPLKDRELLSTGINIHSDQELRSTIEDYNS